MAQTSTEALPTMRIRLTQEQLNTVVARHEAFARSRSGGRRAILKLRSNTSFFI